jgi:hypothetical protein
MWQAGKLKRLSAFLDQARLSLRLFVFILSVCIIAGTLQAFSVGHTRFSQATDSKTIGAGDRSQAKSRTVSALLHSDKTNHRSGNRAG